MTVSNLPDSAKLRLTYGIILLIISFALFAVDVILLLLVGFKILPPQILGLVCILAIPFGFAITFSARQFIECGAYVNAYGHNKRNSNS